MKTKFTISFLIVVLTLTAATSAQASTDHINAGRYMFTTISQPSGLCPEVGLLPSVDVVFNWERANIRKHAGPPAQLVWSHKYGSDFKYPDGFGQVVNFYSQNMTTSMYEVTSSVACPQGIWTTKTYSVVPQDALGVMLNADNMTCFGKNVSIRKSGDEPISGECRDGAHVFAFATGEKVWLVNADRSVWIGGVQQACTEKLTSPGGLLCGQYDLSYN